MRIIRWQSCRVLLDSTSRLRYWCTRFCRCSVGALCNIQWIHCTSMGFGLVYSYLIGKRKCNVSLISPGKVPDLEQIQIWHSCSRSGTIYSIMHCICTFKFKFQTWFSLLDSVFFCNFLMDTCFYTIDVTFYGKKVKNEINFNWLHYHIISIVLIN